VEVRIASFGRYLALGIAALLAVGGCGSSTHTSGRGPAVIGRGTTLAGTMFVATIAANGRPWRKPGAFGGKLPQHGSSEGSATPLTRAAQPARSRCL
jgi:hypothetical protein